MSAQALGSRAIIGEFYRTLDQNAGMDWVGATSMLFNSDQSSETYNWLGQSPVMAEWIGGRNAKGFTSNGITIANTHFEASLYVYLEELRRDKSGQVMVRIQELADRTNAHWAKLLSTLIVNGESTACYDGQFFFDTDHSEGDSGTQSNDITVTIASIGVPTDEQGTTTNPSPRVIAGAISNCVSTMMGFVDDQGEPMNENASSFTVMVPATFMQHAQVAVGAQFLPSGGTNPLTSSGISYQLAVNPRLSWTTKLAVFRTDGRVKPFIRQSETDVMLKSLAEGSEEEALNDRHFYGVDAWRNVGYGYWQHACLATLA